MIKIGQRFRSVMDEIDTDEYGEERTTPAGSVWLVTGHNNRDVWDLACDETGAWICPNESELRNPAQFTPLED